MPGSDSGALPHGDNGKQFSRMVQFGMTPLQALQSATIHSARLLNWEGGVGQINGANYADVIAIGRNPLAAIGIIETVTSAMKNGVLYKHE